MNEPGMSTCASCGKREDEVRKLLSASDPALCDECIGRYAAALQRALDDDSRRRSGVSELVAAEEMALNLIDTLETTRADRAREAVEAPSQSHPLRLVQLEELPFMAAPSEPGLDEELEPEPDEEYDEVIAEAPTADAMAFPVEDPEPGSERELPGLPVDGTDVEGDE